MSFVAPHSHCASTCMPMRERREKTKTHPPRRLSMLTFGYRFSRKAKHRLPLFGLFFRVCVFIHSSSVLSSSSLTVKVNATGFGGGSVTVYGNFIVYSLFFVSQSSLYCSYRLVISKSSIFSMVTFDEIRASHMRTNVS